MDTLAIQRSLTILEDRYRELREIGEKHRQAWEAEETNLRVNLAEVRGEKEGLERELGEVRGEKEGLERELGEVRGEKEGLERELGEVRGEKEGLERELGDVREESELLLLQLHQVQEELEYNFLNYTQLKSDHEALGARKRAEREEKEGLALQLEQKIHLIEILEYESRLKDQKLDWLRSQRQLLIHLAKYYFSILGRFADLSLRFKSSGKASRSNRFGGLVSPQGIFRPRSSRRSLGGHASD